jgi:IS5 family transposase
MRKNTQKQMPLTITSIDHPHAAELEGISQILDDHPIIYDWVLQDLTRDVLRTDTGAEGMSAEQVLRAAIIKQMEGYSYEELAFHLLDSVCYRGFCRIGIADKGFQKSALCNNIKAVSSTTWESINRILVAYGQDKGVEKGKQARMDCTVVSSNIHEPKDSSLLWDCVRVLTRMLGRINERFEELGIPFSDHSRRAKRRMLEIMNANSKKVRDKKYEELLEVTHMTVNYARAAVSLLETHPFVNSSLSETARGMAEELKGTIRLTDKVIDQTTRRVIHDESVPACEKIVSIFEPHTDIIVKERRETFYGHKVCLTGGASNLISDCLILDGNPADSSLTTEMFNAYPVTAQLEVRDRLRRSPTHVSTR